MLYLIVLLATTIEGPIATIVAGFLAAQGLVNVFIIVIIAIIGDVLGDIIHYSLGRWGMRSIVNRWGKYIGVTQQKIAQLEKYFVNHSGKTLLLGKLAHGIGGLFLIAAGASRMPISKFIFFNTLGSTPKTTILVIIGYYFGSAITKINNFFDLLAIIIIVIFLGIFLFYFFSGRFNKRIKNKL